jgi:nicotinamide mononucleotide transporter
MDYLDLPVSILKLVFAWLINPANRFEIVASILGLVSVWLNVRENPWAWPIGLVMVGMYVVIFWKVHLYADFALQLFYYVPMQLYGWWAWLRGGQQQTPLHVSLTPPHLRIGLILLALLSALGLGYFFDTYTDAALPYWDSFIAGGSLVCQWMLARKLLENWVGWFVVDVVAVGVYASKHLWSTTVLYAVFLVLAVMGYRQWLASYRADLAPAA